MLFNEILYIYYVYIIYIVNIYGFMIVKKLNYHILSFNNNNDRYYPIRDSIIDRCKTGRI